MIYALLAGLGLLLAALATALYFGVRYGRLKRSMESANEYIARQKAMLDALARAAGRVEELAKFNRMVDAADSSELSKLYNSIVS